MQSTIRRLVDADVETVVTFSLAAWAPVFVSLEVELDHEVYHLMWAPPGQVLPEAVNR
jgi:hypothetical protein